MISGGRDQVSRPLPSMARASAWPGMVVRGGGALQRRLRDSFVARRLGAPGFRTGRTPRLLGLDHMHLGEDFHAGDSLWLEAVIAYGGQRFQPALRIGPHARLSDNVHIGCLARITIGAHLLCGSRVLISDHSHGQYSGEGSSDPAVPPAERVLHSPAPVAIGENVWLGDGVAVLPGAEIGDGCVIGANAVVAGPIPARTIAVGIPARPVKVWSDVERAWVPVAPR